MTSDKVKVLEETDEMAVSPASLIDDTADELEAIEVEPVEYTSIEEFQKKENVVIAIPDIAWLDMEPERENITLLNGNENVMISLAEGEKYFYLTQWDHRAYTGYGSASAFGGESVNERHFTNEQGLDYVMFDTLEDGEIISTHAVISVNGRDLTLDFGGFEQEKIEQVLRQLDLSIYFEE